jgi:ribosomal protein S18 acetylase RimI-like enzyme
LLPGVCIKKNGFDAGGLRKAYYADNGEDAIIMWKNEL